MDVRAKPTDEQIKEFIEMFGSKIPNPEQYPKCFEHYWKMYLLSKQ